MSDTQQQQPETEKQSIPPSHSPEPMRQRDRSPSLASEESSADSNRPSRRRDRRRDGRQRQSNNLPLVGGEDPTRAISNTTGGVGQTAGKVLGQATGGGEEGSSKKDTLKLRLDINLDVDISIKAKVHGDVTLSLLD